MIKYATIIFPLPLNQKFTYSIPNRLLTKAKPGKRVLAPLGRFKVTMGVISSLEEITEYKKENIKELIDIIDECPSFDTTQLQFIEWISNYYMSSVGQVLKTAIPSGMNIVIKKYLKKNLSAPFDKNRFNDVQQKIIGLINNGKINEEDILKEFGKVKARREIEYLINNETIKVSYDIKDSYSPNYQKGILLSDDISIQKIIKELENKPKQQDIILKYIDLQKKSDTNNYVCPIPTILKNNISRSSINTLIKREVFVEKYIEISRHPNYSNPLNDINKLSLEQQKAFEAIVNNFEKKDVVLLQGITGSGKTEIYIKLISDLQDEEGQILFLVPEIALTTQLVTRLSSIFGNKLAVYTSRYNSNERMEVWNNVKNDEKKIIVGTRSSIFLPFKNLQLVIIDEEHDSSYKQYDPAPRYNARDASIYLSKLHQAKVLLGTATPSLETYYNCINDKYRIVELKNRFSNISLPKIETVDTSKQKPDSHTIFHPHTLSKINEELKKGNQIIVFQNRRGYTPIIQCETCSWYPKCKNCDVSLTYHQSLHKLVCHYCGSKNKIAEKCVDCKSTGLRNQGYGTERIMEELESEFEGTKILRMDHDTTRTKNSLKKIISDFESKKAQILVGTQMVSKGFDFGGVTLVVIPDFDMLYKIPDFRSREKCFQISTQVMGRSGRRNIQGTMILQTKNPDKQIIDSLENYSIKELYKEELCERKEFNYPPYSRIIKITTKGKNFKRLNSVTYDLYSSLKNLNDIQILGPEIPFISKIKNEFLINIWIKIPNHSLLNSTKKCLFKNIERFKYTFQKNYSKIVIDVDPIQ